MWFSLFLKKIFLNLLCKTIIATKYSFVNGKIRIFSLILRKFSQSFCRFIFFNKNRRNLKNSVNKKTAQAFS